MNEIIIPEVPYVLEMFCPQCKVTWKFSGPLEETKKAGWDYRSWHWDKYHAND